MQDIDVNLTEGFARELYTSYCEAVGGKAFNGDPLPDWKSFRSDPNKSKQSQAWIASGRRVVEILHRRHVFWGAGEPDCPSEIKARNGELYALQCKVCGIKNPKQVVCWPLSS